MTYKVVLKGAVRKDIKVIDKKVARRILGELKKALSKDPYQNKKLRGPFEGLRRHRIGDYRAIYFIREPGGEGRARGGTEGSRGGKGGKGEARVIILRIAHRKEVYRL